MNILNLVPPKGLVLCRSGGACVLQGRVKLCQPGATMLERLAWSFPTKSWPTYHVEEEEVLWLLVGLSLKSMVETVVGAVGNGIRPPDGVLIPETLV